MLQRNRQHLSITGILAGAAIFAAALPGCGGEDPNAAAPETPPMQTASGGSGGMAPSGDVPGGPAMPMGAPGGPGGSGSSINGMMGAPGNSAGGQQAAAGKPAGTPPPGSRPDPFRPWFSTTPPPPPVLAMIDPIRIASSNTVRKDPPPNVTIQEMPTRRVAGILTGNGVYALLDDGSGVQQVIKPGDLLDDGYRVAQINSTSVTLRKKVGPQTFTQVVPLTDAGSTPQFGGPGGGMPMGPGGGQFGPPGGGRRGLPGLGAPGTPADI
jgi:hypothetical protein